jgi:hypothetical protein
MAAEFRFSLASAGVAPDRLRRGRIQEQVPCLLKEGSCRRPASSRLDIKFDESLDCLAELGWKPSGPTALRISQAGIVNLTAIGTTSVQEAEIGIRGELWKESRDGGLVP